MYLHLPIMILNPFFSGSGGLALASVKVQIHCNVCSGFICISCLWGVLAQVNAGRKKNISDANSCLEAITSLLSLSSAGHCLLKLL